MADELDESGPLEFRPLSGRGTVRTLEFKPVLDLLSTQASASAPVVVAGADDKYNYRVQRFPAASAALQAVQARLKQGFDPSSILNPLAKL